MLFLLNFLYFHMNKISRVRFHPLFTQVKSETSTLVSTPSRHGFKIVSIIVSIIVKLNITVKIATKWWTYVVNGPAVDLTIPFSIQPAANAYIRPLHNFHPICKPCQGIKIHFCCGSGLFSMVHLWRMILLGNSNNCH